MQKLKLLMDSSSLTENLSLFFCEILRILGISRMSIGLIIHYLFYTPDTFIGHELGGVKIHTDCLGAFCVSTGRDIHSRGRIQEN